MCNKASYINALSTVDFTGETDAGLCFGLYVVYINDRNVNLNIYALKFADDANVFSEVSSLDKVENMQSDLDEMNEWSEDLQMLSNAQKCRCMHIGYKNTYANYFIGGDKVTNSIYERDLGVVIG